MSSAISFLASGGNPFLHLHERSERAIEQPIQGSWATVEFQPDLFAPQSFTVGVVVKPNGGRVHYHLLSDLKKFDCIYGANFPKNSVTEFLSDAEECLRLACKSVASIDQIEFCTPNLRLSKPVFTSGQSAEEILTRLYSDVVILEPNALKVAKSSFETLDNLAVRKLVNEKLKEIAALDYNRIVIDAGDGFLAREGDRTHHLDFNLKTSTACGSVVSAVYKSPQHIEMNLLRANLDLNTYALIAKNITSRGVFLMLPEKGQLDPKEVAKMEDIIGEQSWKLEKDGFRVSAFSSPDMLASDIYEWAKPNL